MTRPRFGDVIEIIALATRARFLLGQPSGERYMAPVMSAGALHAIRLVIIPLTGRQRAFVYMPIENTVDQLYVHRREYVDAFRAKVSDCLPDATGTALALLADRTAAGQAYANPETLLWRDSGALLQTLAMIAHAEGHAFCPLGIHGTEIVQGLELTKDFIPVGAAIIGRHVGH